MRRQAPRVPLAISGIVTPDNTRRHMPKRSSKQNRPASTAANVSCQFPSPGEVAQIRRYLRAWYRRHGRRFPWRVTHDPYAIWVSEVMLQQTTTAVVEKYFERFLKRFPTVQDLAHADEEEVLRLWEGLGYYRRARQLHEAAKVVVFQYGGIVPQTVERLMKLPGIGRYTAGAIVSLAYNRPAPILEANTRRLFARWLGLDGSKPNRSQDRLLWQFAEHLLPKHEPAVINQALMDLGHDVCLPSEPRCPHCPIAKFCRTFQNGCIPSPTRNKTVFTTRHEVALLIEHDHHLWMVRYGAGGRWAGLWDVPRMVLAENPVYIPTPAKMELASIVQAVQTTWTFPLIGKEHFLRLRYPITRYRVVLDVFLAEVLGQFRHTPTSLPSGVDEARWIPFRQVEQLPLPSSTRRVLNTWFTPGDPPRS